MNTDRMRRHNAQPQPEPPQPEPPAETYDADPTELAMYYDNIGTPPGSHIYPKCGATLWADAVYRYGVDTGQPVAISQEKIPGGGVRLSWRVS